MSDPIDTGTALSVRSAEASDGGGLFPGLNLREAFVFCKTAAHSGMVPAKTAEEAMMVVLAGREHGLTAMASLMNCHMIKGKFTMSADMVAALATRRGVVIELVESTSDKATYSFSGAGRTVPFSFTYTMADAKRAGLLGKSDSNWEKHPGPMLRARALTQGLRAVYPGLLSGAYLTDEIREVIDVTPVTQPSGNNGHASLGLPAPVPEASKPKDEPSPRVKLARECAEIETNLTTAQRLAARDAVGANPTQPVNGSWALDVLEAYHAALVEVRDTREPGDEQADDPEQGLPL